MQSPPARFSGDPHLAFPLDGSKPYLLDKFWYLDDIGRKHIIPALFRTDGASIPRFFWRVVGHPFEPRPLPGAIIHDWYCDKAASLAPIDLGQAQSLRLDADRLFCEILRVREIGIIKRSIMYRGVRIGALGLRKLAKPVS